MASPLTRVGLQPAVASFTFFVGFVLSTPFLSTWGPRRLHSLLHLRTRSQRAPECGNLSSGACSSCHSLSLAASTSSAANLQRTRHLDSRKSRCARLVLVRECCLTRLALVTKCTASVTSICTNFVISDTSMSPNFVVSVTFFFLFAHVLRTISRSSRILIFLWTFFTLFLLRCSGQRTNFFPCLVNPYGRTSSNVLDVAILSLLLEVLLWIL